MVLRVTLTVMFDHLQLYSVLLRIGHGLFPGVALIHIRQLHVFSGCCLYRPGEVFDLRPILFIGRQSL